MVTRPGIGISPSLMPTQDFDTLNKLSSMHVRLTNSGSYSVAGSWLIVHKNIENTPAQCKVSDIIQCRPLYPMKDLL